MTNTEFHSEKAILKTLIYSDIFHFPLSKDELWQFLISDHEIDRASFDNTLTQLVRNLIQKKNGWYCLKGSEKTITKRIAHAKYVQKKFHLAKRAAYMLSHIPTISFIGVSGGVAMNNADKDADIDLFIIVRKGSLFMTRLWVIFLLEVFGMRRKRSAKANNIADKICANLFIDETSLVWPTNKRDVYIAHEIVQVKPLFERNDMYRKFFNANAWIKKFLPNSTMQSWSYQRATDYYSIHLVANVLGLPFFERLAKKLQERIMKRHRTNETVSDRVLAFHPRDYRRQTIKLFEARCEEFHVLTSR